MALAISCKGSKYVKVIWAVAAALAKLEGCGAGGCMWIVQWLVCFGSPDLRLGRQETGGYGLA